MGSRIIKCKISKQESNGIRRRCHMCKTIIPKELKCFMFVNGKIYQKYKYSTVCPRCLSKASNIADQEKAESELVAKLV